MRAGSLASPFIGCAGWSLPGVHSKQFTEAGSHLERYASRFNGVEINSSFYRTHRPETYARWAASVPEHFRFAVKTPKDVTHERMLVNTEKILDEFLKGVLELKSKLGPLLIQLPPRLDFQSRMARKFLRAMRKRFDGDIVWEPRHPSWFDAKVDRLFVEFRIARVAADPAVVPEAAEPGGSEHLVYYRLHGSPRKYYSSYSRNYLRALATKLAPGPKGPSTWCIFDNTALGAATRNALDLLKRHRKLRSEV